MLNHKGTQRLETERLILRQFKIEDYREMYKNWANDDEVTISYLVYTFQPGSFKRHFAPMDRKLLKKIPCAQF